MCVHAVLGVQWTGIRPNLLRVCIVRRGGQVVVGEGATTFSELGPPIALRAHAVGVTTKAPTVSDVRWHSYGDLDVRQVQ